MELNRPSAKAVLGKFYSHKLDHKKVRNFFQKINAMEGNISPESLLGENGITVRYGKAPGSDIVVTDTRSTPGKTLSFPTDGFTDKHRVRDLVKPYLPPKLQNLLLVGAAKLNDMDIQLSMDLLFNRNNPENAPGIATPKIWGGSYQTLVQDHLDEEGEEVIGVPEDQVYTNILVYPYERKMVKGIFGGLQELTCGGHCGEPKKHVHYVRANYNHKFRPTAWTAPAEDAEPVPGFDGNGMIDIAPPLPDFVEAPLEVKSKKAFLLEKALVAESYQAPARVVPSLGLGQGSESAATSSAGGSVSSEASTEDLGCKRNAEVADKVSCTNSLQHLQRIMRYAPNTLLRDLTPITGSTNATNKKKKELSAKYTDSILPLVGSVDMIGLIDACKTLAKSESPNEPDREDRFLGYFLQRLAAGDANLKQQADLIVVQG